MSIIVRNMEMPKRCFDCPCCWAVRHFECLLAKKDLRKEHGINISRPNWCPLIEVPTPHGRLIDTDAHILEIRKQYCEDCSRRKGIKNGKMKFLYEIGGVVCRACEIEDMLNELDDAPTVIEAEGTE